MVPETAIVAVSFVFVQSLSKITATTTTVVLFLVGTVISLISNLSTTIALLVGIAYFSKRCLVSAVVAISYLL